MSYRQDERRPNRSFRNDPVYSEENGGSKSQKLQFLSAGNGLVAIDMPPIDTPELQEPAPRRSSLPFYIVLAAMLLLFAWGLAIVTRSAFAEQAFQESLK